MSWTSKLMDTASPTSRPPASRAAFQVRPKSFRLIRVVAESPIRVFPHGSFCAGLGPSTSKTTFRVTPRIVRSPLAFSSPSGFFDMDVELKVKSGWFSTWKKSALFRCASRWGSRVLMVLASMEARILDLVTSFSLRSRTPVIEVNSPNTFEIIHVLDLELGRGVNAIDNPRAGGSFRLNRYGAHFHSPLIRIVVITTKCWHCIHANGQPDGLKPALMTCKISTYGQGKIY